MAKEPTIKLRECPFCPARHPHLAADMENSARIVSMLPGENCCVECCVCGACTSVYSTPERAAAAWNTRKADALREALEKAHQWFAFMEETSDGNENPDDDRLEAAAYRGMKEQCAKALASTA
jgi:hypothetical protein